MTNKKNVMMVKKIIQLLSSLVIMIKQVGQDKKFTASEIFVLLDEIIKRADIANVIMFDLDERPVESFLKYLDKADSWWIKSLLPPNISAIIDAVKPALMQALDDCVVTYSEFSETLAAAVNGLGLSDRVLFDMSNSAAADYFEIIEMLAAGNDLADAA